MWRALCDYVLRGRSKKALAWRVPAFTGHASAFSSGKLPGNRGLGHSAAARLPLGSVSTSPLWGHRLPYAASGLQNVTALASRHLRAWRLPGTRGPSPLPALPFPLEFTDRDWMEPAGYEPGGASLGSGVPEMSAHFWAGSLAQEVTYMCVCDVSLGVHPGSWT